MQEHRPSPLHKLQPIACAILLAAGTLAVSARAGQPATSSSGTTSTTTETRSPGSGTAATPAKGGFSHQDREFIRDAAQAGLAEVQASQLALSKSSDADIKSFAQRIVDDHTKAHEQLQQIAQDAGVKMPTGASMMQKSRLALLRHSDGQKFNERYADDFGVNAHRKTIELFRKEAAKGQNPQLKQFATQTLATLQEHLQMAQTMQSSVAPTAAVNKEGASGSSNVSQAQKSRSDDLRDATEEVNASAQVIQQMKRDPRMAELLNRAKGLFILPHYGRGALGVGVQGGEGVLVTRQGNDFSNPVFYNLGGVSIGAQAGGAGGPVAMLLMTDRAVQDFKSDKKFSINADAGLTIVKYSARAQASGGKVQDVVVWSGTKGAYAGVSVGVTDVMWDGDANRAYYRRSDLNPQQILDGSVPNPQHNVLGMVLKA